MHVGMVRLGGEKMSKSLGNLVFVGDLLIDHDPAAIRLALLSRHYRTSWEWDHGLLDDAVSRVAAWRKAGQGAGALEEVRHHLDEDLDTPSALGAIDAAVAAGKGVSHAAALLGVTL
jgi:L-cysteine:1D-myo-inositol 2-amino-2-deoxy-alpha-D-glucopyranoside ligase